MSKYNDDDFNPFNSMDDDEKRKKLEDFLRRLAEDNDEKSLFDDNDDDDDTDAVDEAFGEPDAIEVIVQGDWTIKISTWKKPNGITTEKVQLSGPEGKVPDEIKDFITNRISSKGGTVSNSILKSPSQEAEDLLKEILTSVARGEEQQDEKFDDINKLAKYWYINRIPNYDAMIDKALEVEDYDKAAAIRDKKAYINKLQSLTLEKISEAVERGDFVAIDTLMAAYKTKLPQVLRK